MQAAMVVMMTCGDIEDRTQVSHNVKPVRGAETGHGGPKLETPKFNWDAQDSYVELVNFELKVTNILETRAYKKVMRKIF